MEQQNENVQFSKRKIIKNLNVLSVAFLLLYTAYNGLTMLQSTMNKVHGIGTAGQATLYISYGLSSLLLSSYAIKKLGIKIAQILGMLLYLPYIAANFYPSWWTIIPSAILIGLGSTLNWGAQCTYFNECSVMFNRLVNENSDGKDSNPAQDYTNDPPLEYIPDIQISEGMALSSLLRKGQTNQDLNEDGKELSLHAVPDIDLSDKYIRNRASKVLENTTEKTNAGKAVAELFPSVEDGTMSSAELKQLSLQGKDGTSHSLPVRDIEKSPSERSESSLSSTNAVFFGLHGLAYCSSQIWSNLICFYVLSTGIAQNFNKTLKCSCGANFCNTDEDCVDSRIEDVPIFTRDLLTGLCVVLGAIGAVLVWLLLDPMKRKNDKVYFSWQHFFVTIKYIKKKEQLFVIPLTILGGMTQAFYTADITKAYIACAWTISEVGMVTVFYGIASALSSIFSGVLIKYCGRQPVLLLCQVLNMANLCFLLLWEPDAEASYIFYIEAAVFGFVAGIFHTQVKALYGVFFEGDEETAFSSSNMYSAVGWSVTFLYSDFICTSAKIYVSITLSCLAIIGYVFSERSFNTKRKNQIKATNTKPLT